MSSDQNHQAPGWLVFDIETVPDGDLIARVKYPHLIGNPREAIRRAMEEALSRGRGDSSFVAPTFMKVVAACVIRVRKDYSVEKMVCLDAPQFRQQQVVEQFWKGVCSHAQAPLVSFNGRGFDLPVMELAAFDHGIDISAYMPRRERFKGAGLHIDLQEFFSNQGALRFFTGGLNLLAKRVGLPGKQGTTGDDVYDLVEAGRLDRVNGYCLADTLDTYFVFLRSQRMIGRLKEAQEAELRRDTLRQLRDMTPPYPGIDDYLAHFEKTG
jgi:predicted PolB exonuclease-like 3'-5' exonuclease